MISTQKVPPPAIFLQTQQLTFGGVTVSQEEGQTRSREKNIDEDRRLQKVVTVMVLKLSY